MKVSSVRSSTVPSHAPENRPRTPTVQARSRMQSLGKLCGLSATSQPRSNGDKRSFKSNGSKTNTTMGADVTPFHAGTRNDCGLHTTASLTGWSEPEVVQNLVLTLQQIEHISAHCMQPDDVIAALHMINNDNVELRQGTIEEMAKNVANIPDGHQFALGMQRVRTSGTSFLLSA